ncbi:MAG: AMP-binding protein [Proteobacteria bacterium]|nr:AMP-binding protein [Pseudomonadota bacterium]MBU1450697.1 AMP-binding protein [Pseudomonadota bacterium]MBU2468636.1 AMP-binding protein [Pseudomonadota bacterium]MBU2517672.1 AMP-binding protein [Pseudomonadota bacterium]
MPSVYEQKPWLKFYPAGVAPEVDIPDKSINDLFDEVVEKYKKRVALIFYGTKITYQELGDKVLRMATALASLGVKKGDRVALLLLNAPEHVIAFYAVQRLGAVVTAISPVYVSSEMRHQLDDSQATSLICQDFLYPTVEKSGYQFANVILASITDSLPKLKKMMGTTILRGVYQKMAAPPADIYNQEHFYGFHELLQNHPPQPPRVELNVAEDIVTLPYTGGTTGPPKGVMITHRNAVSNLYQFKNYLNMIEEGSEVWMAYMPFYHAAGQVVALIFGVLMGFTLVVITTPDVEEILSAMGKYKATTFFGAPTIYEVLKDEKKTDRVNWRKLKLVLSGADALHEYTAKDWKVRTGTDIFEGYGQTECVALTHETAAGHVKIGSVGLPICNTQSAILDPEEDQYMPVGEIGEIVVSGPQICKGYWRNEAATNECIAEIGGIRWWRTGDLGRMDENGFFYVYDRKRDLIKYKGLRVYAREVEEVLRTHPKIKEVGVIGVPDRKVGEQVKALVVLESDSRGNLSEADIMSYCEDKLAYYKIPRIIEFVGEVPRTDVGKVSRRELREEES